MLRTVKEISLMNRDNWERNDKQAMEHYSDTAW